MIGIILAGGKGSRLGPMAAQISKALVTFGQRPMVINQVEQLKKTGCDDILVVTSNDTNTQVRGVLNRSIHKVRTVVQREPLGPVDAIRTALVEAKYRVDEEVVILMSDTWVDELIPTGEWVGVHLSPPGHRSWCYRELDTEGYVDGIPESTCTVTIGAYRFMNAAELLDCCFIAMQDRKSTETPMSALLNCFPHIKERTFTTWLDLGDVMSLARARRSQFRTRAHHKMEMTSYGTIIKYGVSQEEFGFADELSWGPDKRRASLFPAIHQTNEASMSYEMEAVDLPSLAELWLYWPGRPDTWADILQSVIDQVQTNLWTTETTKYQHAGKWIAEKAINRLSLWDHTQVTDNLLQMIHNAAEVIGDDVWVDGHGDLNFTNILYSLNNGTIKLLDPRGGMVPKIYEYAKLGYSQWFAPIAHDQFQYLPLTGNVLYPNDQGKSQALDILHRYVDEERLNAAMALTLLAAPPLHPHDQAKALYAQGHDMLRKVSRVSTK